MALLLKNPIIINKNRQNQHRVHILFPNSSRVIRKIIITNNKLHFEIIINPKAFSAAHDIAGISDVIAESAISTICDNEDSVAAVDAEDKVICYKNWLGLMKGELKN